MAVAEASLSTCTLSMSFVFRKLMSPTIIPSTTKSGSESFSVPMPRTLTVIPEPGAPEKLVTSTPATCPCRAWAKVDADSLLTSFMSTTEMAPVTSFFFCVP